MAKKKAATDSKAAAKLQKKAKQEAKNAKNEIKTLKGKGKATSADDEDLDAILNQFQEDWKAAHAVTEEVQSGAPSRRVNATFTSAGDFLYLIGGEYFDGGKAYFYNDTFRYSPDKNEWRQYTCPTAPAPRSAHAAVVLPKDGGSIWIFGGEFASQSQTTFHHYKDLWSFSLKDHSWAKVETKGGPSARSGHRMAVWKQYIVLFGGFHDLGIRTSYLSDLWLFDTDTYKWKQIEMRDTDRAPGARSGFSMIACPEGVLVHGGYRKEFTKGSKPVGVALDDTWMLHMDAVDPTKLKWERKKKAGYAPTTRSGCSMTLWASKNMGVLFGGVHDEEDEDDIKSVFYNDLYAYNLANNRWVSLGLQLKKKRGGAAGGGGGGAKAKRRAAEQLAKMREQQQQQARQDEDDDEDVDMDGGDGREAVVEKNGDDDSEDDEDEDESDDERARGAGPARNSAAAGDMEIDDGAPSPAPTETVAPKTSSAAEQSGEDRPVAPLERYNAMITILKNTLYVYGGIYETEKREYTLDDFYTLNLEKRTGWTTLRASGIDEEQWAGSDDEEEEDEGMEEEEEDDDDDDGEDEEIELQIDAADQEADDGDAEHARMSQAEKDALRDRAKKFLGSAKDASSNANSEDSLSTPLPGETLRAFYQRSKEYWVNKAFEESENRGKVLRREAFGLCDSKYTEYKPLLQEIERIQREAEVEAVDRKTLSTGPGGGGGDGGSRNRR